MQIKKIIIGIDGSKHADHAAQYGFNMAHTFNAAVGLVNIVELTPMPLATNADPLMGAAMQPDVGLEEMDLMESQNILSKAVIDGVIKKYAGDLKITHFSEFGNKAEGIINCSNEFGADLIVIGTHSRTGLDRLLMGSVAEHVVRHAEVPVLVVPMKEGHS
jgi:nucleotide-binding universal stress UspA family protein